MTTSGDRTSCMPHDLSLNNKLGKIGFARLTKTINNGYFFIQTSEVPTTRAVITTFYNSTNPRLNYTYSISNSSGTNSMVVYVRDNNGNLPPNNTGVTINVIWIES